jgi:hypothetical protein
LHDFLLRSWRAAVIGMMHARPPRRQRALQGWLWGLPGR